MEFINDRSYVGEVHESVNSELARPQTTIAVKENVSLKSIVEEVETADLSPFNGSVFILTNELNSEKVMASLKETPCKGNTGIYTSGLLALDLAALERNNSYCDLENIIIVDYSQKVRDFWVVVEKIIIENESRRDTFDKIKELILDPLQEAKEQIKAEYADAGGLPAGVDFQDCAVLLKEKIEQGISFLSTDEKYKKIRDIFCNDRFAFVLLDLCDQKKTAQLGKLLDAHSLEVDTLYVSNIYSLLLEDLELACKKQKSYDVLYKANFGSELLRRLQELGAEQERSRPNALDADFWTRLGQNKLFQEAQNIDKLAFNKQQLRFAELYQNETEHDKALKIISQATQEQFRKQDLWIKKDRDICESFVVSLENILGNSNRTINTNLIHASYTCDRGCCINPMRVDEAAGIKQMLQTKTPCGKVDQVSSAWCTIF